MSHGPFTAELSAERRLLNPGKAPVRISHNLPDWPANLECVKHDTVWKILLPGSETLAASICKIKRPGWLAWLLSLHEFRLTEESREIARVVECVSVLTLSIGDESVCTVCYGRETFFSAGLSWQFAHQPKKACYLTAETPCQLRAAILAGLVLWENCLFSA